MSNRGLEDAQFLVDPSTTGIQTRLLAILVLFVVSLFASFLPTLSKHVSYLRIPRIVFFIGKHFGTGVILATAFAHLLQDAFDALRDPVVLARWKIGRHTGLIILASLLSIFLVEYISTSYVDCLQSYSSPSSTPQRDPSPDSDEPRSSTAPKIADGTDPERQPLLSTGNGHTYVHKDCHHHCEEHDHREDQHAPHSHHQHTPFYGTTHTHSQDHARIRTTSATSAHHGNHDHHAHRDTDASGGNNLHGGAVILEGHHRHEPRTAHSAHHDRGPRLPSLYGEDEPGRRVVVNVGCVHGRDGDRHVDHGHHAHHAHGHRHGLAGAVYGDAEKEIRVGKKRQIIGILVLQLGIMIHSFVIGLTLAIMSGSEFASLLIAVIFHQLFEGLSLGIRIAALPSSSSYSSCAHEATLHPDASLHLDLHPDDAYISPHEKNLSKFITVLKPTLACLFAITTPAGIGLGMLVFKAGADIAYMRLTQGLMSAISAGMLIYAACVEMLAADFVMDPTLWRSGWVRQAIAVGSLVLGVCAMGVIS